MPRQRWNGKNHNLTNKPVSPRGLTGSCELPDWLQALADFAEQVHSAAGITPLVVVPAHKLEEFLVQLDAAAGFYGTSESSVSARTKAASSVIVPNR